MFNFAPRIRIRERIKVLALVLFLSVGSLFLQSTEPLNYKSLIVARYQIDEEVFTQGLFYDHKTKTLYHSGGLYGKSKLIGWTLIPSPSIIIKNPGKKGEKFRLKKSREIKIPAEYFAEGITLLNNKLYQLSWQEKTIFVYGRNLKLLNTAEVLGEGWGLATDGKNLIRSDGTQFIHFHNPDNFKIEKKMNVWERKGRYRRPVKNLNAMEWANNTLYANIYKTQDIAMIDIRTGQVVGKIDGRGLMWDHFNKYIKKNSTSRLSKNDRLLNGIAHFRDEYFFVTGKNWKVVYLVKFNLNK